MHTYTHILLSYGSANPQEMKEGSHCSLIPVSCCSGSFGAWRRETGPVDAPTHGVLGQRADRLRPSPMLIQRVPLLEINVLLTPLSFRFSVWCVCITMEKGRGEKGSRERHRERKIGNVYAY